MKIPGFTAEASLYPSVGIYGVITHHSEDRGEVMPQLRFHSDPDLGAYWRCRLNGGSDLICRFFGGLPPFTIGGFLIADRT